MLVNPIIDLTCSQPFYQWLLSEETSFDVADLKCIDQDIDKTVTNLQGIINEKAKLNNLANYVSLVRHWMLIEGVSTQMEAVREGFNSLFTITSLGTSYPCYYEYGIYTDFCRHVLP